MQVLTTISYYTPYISGLTICAQRLIEELSNRDLEFTVLTSRHQKKLPWLEKTDGVKIIRLPVLFTLGKVPVMPGYTLQLLKEISKTDLVWIHLPQAEGLVVAIVAKLFGKKVVATVHCLPLLPSGWQRLLFQLAFDLVNNLVILLSDRVVYYTKDYAENTKELWHFPKKSRYILPPITMNNEQKTMSNERRGKKQIVVGFAGRVAEDKGFEYLVTAMEILMRQGKKIKLLVAGPKDAVGEKNYVKKIDNLLSEKKINVEFLGAIQPDKMSDFYQKIDCLVLPSVNRTEAFGMVQVEAMKCGVGVIASDLPGVRIPVRLTGNGEVIPPKNSETIAQAIRNIANWALTGEKKLVEKTFSSADSIQSYKKIFGSL